MEQMRNGKRGKAMDHENVVSEWHPFKMKHTKAFQWPASGGGLRRGWAQGAERKNQRRRCRNVQPALGLCSYVLTSFSVALFPWLADQCGRLY